MKKLSKSYLWFQIVFTLLSLNFLIPGLSYTFSPELAMQQLQKVNTLLGGQTVLPTSTDEFFWRYLGTANVMALAFMCLLLQFNLRRFYVVLWPLCFLKGYAAMLWLAGYIAHPQYPVFLGAFILDALSVVLFHTFAGRAHRLLQSS